MANQTAGGYLAPRKPRKPSLASAMAGYPILPNGEDTFGLEHPRGIEVSLTPQAPKPYTPPKPQTYSTPVAAAKPPSTPTVATGFTQPTTPSGGSVYDLSTDPALQQVYAYAGRADADARAAATADKTRLVEQAGLADLARSLGLGDTVADVAASNPFSSAANLKHSYETGAESLSTQKQQNTGDFLNALDPSLFYSGYKRRQLGRLADAFQKAQAENTRGYQQGLSDLAAAVQNQSAGIGSALAQALAGNEQQRLAAEQDARDRAVQNAINTGTEPADTGPATNISGGQTSSVAQALATDQARRNKLRQLQSAIF